MRKQPKENFKEYVDHTILTTAKQAYIATYPILLQRLGCQEGLVLSLLLHRQHYLKNYSKSKRTVLFMTCKEIGKELGLEEQMVHDILTWLKGIELIQTIKRGSPPINNFYFNMVRIWDIVNGPDLKRVRSTRSSKKTKNIVYL
jgi:hypothetical protein